MLKKITTSYNTQYFSESHFEFKKDVKAWNEIVNVYPQKQYQTILGFGGAFTEAGGYALSKLDESKRTEAISKYFGADGINYSFCRTHIASCDFALGIYSYIEDGDDQLKTFSLKRDLQYLVPFIKDAIEMKDGVTLLASPWSPPAFMKTNGKTVDGGKLKTEYYQIYAEYIVKYIKGYKDLGIPVKYISIQNEPQAVQTWDSCLYDSQDEVTFAVNYLKPALDKNDLDVQIVAWDHNKELLYEKANDYFKEDSGVISGLAFHWYTGDHFDTIQMTKEDYPDKLLIFTEGCVEYSRFAGLGDIFNAEMYAHDIIGNLNAGMNAYIDWNMFLDESGGPNHVGNLCAAPIMCDTKNNTFEMRLSYYYIGHFSKYIKPNAKRIGFSKFTDNLDVTAFLNPDGEKVMVVLNKSEKDIPFSVRYNNETCSMTAEKNSICTLIF